MISINQLRKSSERISNSMANMILTFGLRQLCWQVQPLSAVSCWCLIVLHAFQLFFCKYSAVSNKRTYLNKHTCLNFLPYLPENLNFCNCLFTNNFFSKNQYQRNTLNFQAQFKKHSYSKQHKVHYFPKKSTSKE